MSTRDRTANDWVCERHPWVPWGECTCGGAGAPKVAAVELMRNRERFLRQQIRVLEVMVAEAVVFARQTGAVD